MFSALRQNAPFYILYKENEPKLEIGQVISVTNPIPRYNNTFNPNFNDTVVDIKVKVGDNTLNFEKLPANLNIANSGNNGVVVSEDKAAMSNEVESLMNNSKLMLDSMPYHEKVLINGESILKELNPQFAKEKAQEEKISNLEGKVNGIESSISDIKEMLSKALNSNT